MHNKIKLNLQLVKSIYHLGPKTYWTNITVLGLPVTKILLKRTINISVVHSFFKCFYQYLQCIVCKLITVIRGV